MQPDQHQGVACPHTDGFVETQQCNVQDCPIDCVGHWEPWSQCTKSCGQGQQVRSFRITTSAEYGGKTCEVADSFTEQEVCNTQDCPIDCVGEWEDWGSCSETCDGGFSVRTFSVSQNDQHGGLHCEFLHQQIQIKDCNESPCEDVAIFGVIPQEHSGLYLWLVILLLFLLVICTLVVNCYLCWCASKNEKENEAPEDFNSSVQLAVLMENAISKKVEDTVTADTAVPLEAEDITSGGPTDEDQTDDQKDQVLPAPKTRRLSTSNTEEQQREITISESTMASMLTE